jgi:hypothetical protein
MRRINIYVMVMVSVTLFIVPGTFIFAQQDGWWTRDSVNSRVYLYNNNFNVGIGTTTPAAKLEVMNGAVMFRGTTGATPVSGGGTRLMWVPAKAAFRAGTANGPTWDDANIGLRSVAYGFATTASGSYSTASGGYTTASGSGSTAMGSRTTASGNNSTAMGLYTTASGAFSIAIGNYATASGYASAALGNYTTAVSYNDVAIGRYNIGGGTAGSWVATDPLFEIGNGSSASNLSNALTVLKNGNVGIGMPTPQVKLYVAGGIRADSITITNGGADFVFDENYDLRSLEKVEQFIKENKHLPDVQTAEQMQKEGVSVGTLQTKLLQKVEELTLYMIEQNKRIQKLEEENKKLIGK